MLASRGLCKCSHRTWLVETQTLPHIWISLVLAMAAFGFDLLWPRAHLELVKMPNLNLNLAWNLAWLGLDIQGSCLVLMRSLWSNETRIDKRLKICGIFSLPESTFRLSPAATPWHPAAEHEKSNFDRKILGLSFWKQKPRESLWNLWSNQTCLSFIRAFLKIL